MIDAETDGCRMVQERLPEEEVFFVPGFESGWAVTFRDFLSVAQAREEVPT